MIFSLEKEKLSIVESGGVPGGRHAAGHPAGERDYGRFLCEPDSLGHGKAVLPSGASPKIARTHGGGGDRTRIRYPLTSQVGETLSTGVSCALFQLAS